MEKFIFYMSNCIEQIPDFVLQMKEEESLKNLERTEHLLNSLHKYSAKNEKSRIRSDKLWELISKDRNILGWTEPDFEDAILQIGKFESIDVKKVPYDKGNKTYVYVINFEEFEF